MSPTPGVVVRQVDEELLLFDLLTWQTHLLNATASEIVRLIGQSANCAEDLAEALAPGNTAFRYEVDNLLKALSVLGLVECVER